MTERLLVFKQRPFPWKGYHQVDTCLAVTLAGRPGHRKAYAFWRNAGMGIEIPVCEELLTEILGTERTRCPFNDARPVAGGEKSAGYIYIHKGEHTFLACGKCGYAKSFPGHLSRDDFDKMPGRQDVHPQRTYISERRSFALLRDATWKNGCLMPGPNPGQLVIWVKGKRHRDPCASQMAARKVFSGKMTLLADMGKYLVIQVDAPEKES